MLVEPLGVLSVLIGATLASFLLKGELSQLGRLGCTLCLIGSLTIVLQAPPVESVDEILHYVLQPGFLMYCFTALVFYFIMISTIAPRYGRSNPIIYISLCSVACSISAIATEGFSVAVKLTLSGKNQFTHPSTHVLGIGIVICILVQMKYLNKSLDTFPTNIIISMYYIGCSTTTTIAFLILYQSFNTFNGTNIVALLMGFVMIFLGVYLPNTHRIPPPPLEANGYSALEGDDPNRVHPNEFV